MEEISRDERAKIIESGDNSPDSDSGEIIKLLSRTTSAKSRMEALNRLAHRGLDRRKLIISLPGLSPDCREEMYGLLAHGRAHGRGSMQLATDFCNDIANILYWDIGSLVALPNYAKNGSEQRKILEDILSCSDTDTLLSKLLPLRREDVDMKYSDRSTATLIQIALAKSNRERWMLLPKNDNLKHNDKYTADLLQTAIADLSRVTIGGTQSPETVSSDQYESVPFNYPNALIDSLTEFRKAVDDAKKEVINKENKQEKVRANSPIRDSKIIRKNILANSFVAKYKNRYGKLPPISSNGPVHKVFQLLLVAAGFHQAAHFSAFHSAILRAKKDEDRISRLNAMVARCAERRE